ncbi:MAG: dolichyl-phosphate-mannose--protein mannosyltransferase [Bacteroides sp.]|nr:dolichyl-phosphate-mannose--protein mannosyltransferase [Bacteroides sp.]
MKRYITFLLFAAILFTFLPWLGDTLFNTKGEPREAIVALSMIKSGDYILPTSCGGDIPYKPPFLAWLIVLCSWLTGGVNEISARMPSALATIFMAWGFYLFLSRRLADKGNARLIAVISTAVTVTAFEVYRAATACRVDMVLTACIVGAILLFNRRREIDGRPSVSLFGLILMACAVMTKGPVGMILPCLILGIYFLLRGDNFWRAFGMLAFSGLLSLAGYAVWLYLAFMQGGQQFADLVWEENIGRMTGTMTYESHVNPVYYNFITVIAGMLPYTLAALMGLAVVRWRRISIAGVWSGIRSMQPVSLLSLTAIVVTLVFYSIPASKRSVYLLPLYPFLSYFTALMLLEIASRSRRIISIYSGLTGFLALTVAVVAVVVNAVDMQAVTAGMKPDTASFITALHEWSVSFAGWICIAIACIVGFYTFAAIRGGDGRCVMGWGIASTFAIYLVLSSTVQPALLSSKSDLRFARVIERYSAGDEPVYQYISDPMLRYYTAGFYLNDRIVPIQGRDPKQGYVMVNDADKKDFYDEYADKYQLSAVYESKVKSCDTRRTVTIFYFSSDLR